LLIFKELFTPLAARRSLFLLRVACRQIVLFVSSREMRLCGVFRFPSTTLFSFFFRIAENFVTNLLATTPSTSPVLTLQPALSCLFLLPRFAVFLNGRRTIASSRGPWQVFFKFISKLDFIVKFTIH